MVVPQTAEPRRVLSLAPVHRMRSISPTVVRVTVGAVMAFHGMDKLVHGPARFGVYLESLGVPAPEVTGWAVAVGETAGGVLLVVGLLARLVSTLLAIHLSFAMVLVNADTGFITPQQGAASGAGVEFPLLVVAGLVVVVLSGSGPLALDRAVGIEEPLRDDRPALRGRIPREATTAPSAVRASLTSGVIGGVIGAVMSALVNYVVVGVPAGAAANAVNHAVSGLVSGFLAGFLGLLMHQRRQGREPGVPATGDGDACRTVPSGSAVPEV
ncbi:hypothetical protein GCM10010129_77590 [Streptomyces fumigatiscleroticus]|nr:hypothetical protein GCM10010129_77590 [Streptomyces fumigatiscleroticus]